MMDRQRTGFEADDGYSSDAPGIEAPPAVGQDERRMHVRAYNYWAKLLEGRSFPSIESLEIEDIGDFGPHAVLLDFTSGIENPAIAFVGEALAQECELDDSIQYINQVPRRSLLSRLTDHYLQIIANRAPIGFEAEFVNARGATILYRGVLLPFSSDDDTIDFIMGVINWKQAAEHALNDAIVSEMEAASATAHQPRPTLPVWSDGPDAQDPAAAFDSLLNRAFDESEPLVLDAEMAIDPPPLFVANDTAMTTDEDAAPLPFPDAQAPLELADRLADARDCAAIAAQASVRGHAALYQAIARAWAFALASRERPDDYAELLDASGIKASPRAPMTPVVKLVFGIDHDKTRLAEYAAVLTHADDQAIAPEALPGLLTAAPGGIKGLLKDIRAQRRADTARPDTAALLAQRLRDVAPLARVDLPAVDSPGEYILLLGRRDVDGSIAIIAHTGESDPATARMMRAAGK